VDQAETIRDFVNSRVTKNMKSTKWYESSYWFLVSAFLLVVAGTRCFGFPNVYVIWVAFALGILTGMVCTILTIKRHTINANKVVWTATNKCLSAIKSQVKERNGVLLEVEILEKGHPFVEIQFCLPTSGTERNV
jgi:hypothetical protein